MTHKFGELLLALTKPMSPISTGVVPRLARLEGIRAVLFDVYGTLLVSAGGDIGLSAALHHADAMHNALEAVEIAVDADGARYLEVLRQTVREHQDEARARGIEYPEVDIVQVWGDCLKRISSTLTRDMNAAGIDLERLAVEYEWRANPVWAMPNAEDCLETLRRSGVKLGIVSNAQFFTPVSLETLFGKDLEESGFDSDLLVYSFEHGIAKPDARLFEIAAHRLRQRGIDPAETLYVGNDAYKDIYPGARAGFRTALFAGDRRSLQPPSIDQLDAGSEPDLIVTRLAQIPPCLGAGGM